MTDISAEPQWWEVDLGNEYPLASLVIYRLYANKMLPLRVSGSHNGRDYFPVTEYKHNLAKQPIQIPLNGVRARYIRIVSLSIKVPMAFREVAVFPVMQNAAGK